MHFFSGARTESRKKIPKILQARQTKARLLPSIKMTIGTERNTFTETLVTRDTFFSKQSKQQARTLSVATMILQMISRLIADFNHRTMKVSHAWSKTLRFSSCLSGRSTRLAVCLVPTKGHNWCPTDCRCWQWPQRWAFNAQTNQCKQWTEPNIVKWRLVSTRLTTSYKTTCCCLWWFKWINQCRGKQPQN